MTKEHPDKGGDPEKFKLLQQAYETLSDPEKVRLLESIYMLLFTLDFLVFRFRSNQSINQRRT